jgi:thioredoxin 1
MSNILTLTRENFDEVIARDQLLFLDFWTQWCEPCRAFDKVLTLVAEKNPAVLFGKINAEEQPELATEFNIRSIPTVLVMRRQIVLFIEAGLLSQTTLQDLVTQAQALNMDEICESLQMSIKK